MQQLAGSNANGSRQPAQPFSPRAWRGRHCGGLLVTTYCPASWRTRRLTVAPALTACTSTYCTPCSQEEATAGAGKQGGVVPPPSLLPSLLPMLLLLLLPQAGLPLAPPQLVTTAPGSSPACTSIHSTIALHSPSAVTATSTSVSSSQAAAQPPLLPALALPSVLASPPLPLPSVGLLLLLLLLLPAAASPLLAAWRAASRACRSRPCTSKGADRQRCGMRPRSRRSVPGCHQ